MLFHNNAYTPEALIAGAYQLHDIHAEIAGVPGISVTISQTYQLSRYVINGTLHAATRKYLDDYTMIVTGLYGTADEIEGTASELLQYLREMQRHHSTSY